MSRFRDLARSPDENPSGERIEGGIEGHATIDSLTDTGSRSESNPEIELEMTVALPGREPYRATNRTVISQLVLHQLAPGRSVPVLVDPDDLSRIKIG
ncbi:MAG TPA: hypothetical protein VGF21_09600 [Thermoleophilaceae bacterium]|jgi:hypothetical protein